MLRKEADSIGYADISDGDRHPSEPSWLNAIADEMENSKQEDTTEASGHEGQSEAHAHQVSLDGDFDMDRGISDKDCGDIELALMKAGIKGQCQPDEAKQGGVVIHTMADRDATVDALDKAGFDLNETSEETETPEDIKRIKDLACL